MELTNKEAKFLEQLLIQSKVIKTKNDEINIDTLLHKMHKLVDNDDIENEGQSICYLAVVSQQTGTMDILKKIQSDKDLPSISMIALRVRFNSHRDYIYCYFKINEKHTEDIDKFLQAKEKDNKFFAEFLLNSPSVTKTYNL